MAEAVGGDGEAVNELSDGVGDDVLSAFASAETFGFSASAVAQSTLEGGRGDDRLKAADGDDFLLGGADGDTFLFDVAVDQRT